jgi:hypothetical protein
MYKQKYIIIMFDEGQIGANNALRGLAIETEERIKADGYTLGYADGDGWLTFVEFDDIESMLLFKLTYMSYDFKLNYWFLSYSPRDYIEVKFPENWLTSSDSWIPSSQLLRNSGLYTIMVPLHLVDEMITREAKAILLAHSGFISMSKRQVSDGPTGPLYEYSMSVMLPNEVTAVMFRLNV